MIPWIQVYSNLSQHPKLARLTQELALEDTAVNAEICAVGMLVGLWSWAAQCAYDGDLSGCSPRVIARACQWRGTPELLTRALRASGFLDADGHLHDWEDYAGLLVEMEEDRKRKNRERVQRCRARRKAEAEPAPEPSSPQPPKESAQAECNVTVTPECNVTVTPEPNVTVMRGNALTRPDQTKPDLTGQDQEDEARTGASSSCSSCGSAEQEFLRRVNPNASQNCRKELRAYERALGREVCLRAIDTALDAGKGNWPYLHGILRNLKKRGIRTLADWEALERARVGPEEADKRSSSEREDIERSRRLLEQFQREQ